MAQAIAATIKSVVASSVTTIAGFIALCFMSFTLGLDLGIVMTKGVIFGVLCCVTILPSMIMIFDRALEKSKHRQLIPDFPRASGFVVKHHKVFAVLFVVLFIPFAYFQANTDVYYNLDSSPPGRSGKYRGKYKAPGGISYGRRPHDTSGPEYIR